MFESGVYILRRNKLKEKIKSGIILLLGNTDTPMNYPANIYQFRQDSSFLYYFGLNDPGLAGIIDVDNNTEIIFGNDIDLDDVIWMGPQPTVQERSEKAGVADARAFKELSGYISKAISGKREIHFLPPYRGENKILLNELTGIPVAGLKEKASETLIKAIVEMRSVKEEVEIRELVKAAAIGYEMHISAMRMVKPNIHESTIAGLMEGIALSQQGKVSFPIICSQNGETLHNHDHSQTLKEGRLLLIDAGAETPMNYCSDYTRTLPATKKFTPQQKEIYEIVLAANNAATKVIKPGVTYISVHLLVAKVITEGLKMIGLMKGDTDEAVKAGAHAMFFPHGLGHMIGLDVHEMEDLGEDNVGYDDEVHRSQQFGLSLLRLGKKLQPGYAITNEPGIYFIPPLIHKWENEGINKDFIDFTKVKDYIGFGGIRLEDDLLVTENGCSLIGKRLPATVNEIENIMNR